MFFTRVLFQILALMEEDPLLRKHEFVLTSFLVNLVKGSLCKKSALQFSPPHAGILVLDFLSATTSTSALINALVAALSLLKDQDVTDSTYIIDPNGLRRVI